MAADHLGIDLGSQFGLWGKFWREMVDTDPVGHCKADKNAFL